MAARLLPTLPTFSPGPLASTQLTALATYANFFANRPCFRAEQHAAQSIVTATAQQVTCETTVHDSDGGLGLVTPFSYVIPFAGIWDFDGAVSLASNATGWRAPALYQNGTVINSSQPIAAPPPSVTFFGEVRAAGVPCNVGDVIALYIQQNSGSSLLTSTTAQQYSYFAGSLQSLQTP